MIPSSVGTPFGITPQSVNSGLRKSDSLSDLKRQFKSFRSLEVMDSLCGLLRRHDSGLAIRETAEPTDVALPVVDL